MVNCVYDVQEDKMDIITAMRIVAIAIGAAIGAISACLIIVVGEHVFNIYRSRK